MTPMKDILTRWRLNSPTVAFVGAAPEGQQPPYVVFAEQTSMQQKAMPNVVLWTQTSVSFTAVGTTSTEASDLGDLADLVFNQKAFGPVADMVSTMRTTYFMDTPSLTGNRAWVTNIDYAIKH